MLSTQVDLFAAQHDSISLADDRTTDAESRMSYLIEVPRVDVSSLVEDLKMELGMIFELCAYMYHLRHVKVLMMSDFT